MRVFISWSGERSKELAAALRDWLPLVVHYVEPWMSDSDIDAGDRWGQSVAGELAAANFGIVCVTSENVNSPWVLFESGALAKSLEDSKVIPLLLDLEFSDISGPLAQFQAKKVNKAGVQEIISSIQASTDEAIPEDRLTRLFEGLWSDLEQRLSEIPKEPPTERHVRPQQEVLEELVSSIRSLDLRVRESDEMFPDGGSRRIRRRSRLHPILVRELEASLADGPDDPAGLLVYAAAVREELPWIYELATEAYRSLREPRRRGRLRDLERLRRAVDMTMRGPFPPDELGIDPQVYELLAHEFPRYLERLMEFNSRREPSSASSDD